CPSNPTARGTGSMAQSNYAGCHHDVEAPIDADNHGLLFLNSAIRSEDVPDGRSLTLLLGEFHDAATQGWASGTRATLRNTGSIPNAGAFIVPSLGGARLQPGAPLPPTFVGSFSSRHPGGVNH